VVRLLALLAAWLCLALPSHAAGSPFASVDQAPLPQQSFRSWTGRDGLNSDIVLSLARDADGYLWIGTVSGLAQFDGTRIVKNWGPSPLSRARIEGLWTVKGQGLLVGSDVGLFRKVGPVFRKLRGTASVVQALCRAPDGQVFVGAAQGLFRLEGEQLVAALDRSAMLKTDVRALAWNRGALQVGTSQGLMKWVGGSLVRHPDVTAKSAVTALMSDPGMGGVGDGLWVGLGDGRVIHVSENEPQELALPGGQAANWISDFARSQSGVLWAGTLRGLMRWDGSRFVYAQDPGNSDALRMRSLIAGQDDGLIAGTLAGVRFFFGGPVRMFRAPFQAEGRAGAKAIHAASAERAFVVTDAGALFAVASGGTVRSLTSGVNGAKVRAIAGRSGGPLWLGTSAGLRKLVGNSLVVPKDDPGCPVRSLSPVGQDGFWFSCDGGRLFRRQFDTTAPTRVPFALPHLPLLLYESSDRRLWTATREGDLAVLDRGVWAVLPAHKSIGHRYPRVVAEDKTGVIWVGARGALSRFKAGRWASWLHRDDLAPSSISQIEFDAFGGLWLCGASGLYRAEKRAVEAFLDGKGPSPLLREFDNTDGFLARGCDRQPGSSQDGAGFLLFPTTAGVAIVPAEPTFHEAKTARRHLVIESVTVDGTAFDTSGPIVAPPGPGAVTVRFTVPFLRDPGSLRFSHQLAKMPWERLAEGAPRVARYLNVGPGAHTFRVTARDAKGRWPAQTASLLVRIRPSLLQAWWFQLLTGLACAGAAILFVLRILSARRRRVALIEEERHRIARDLHDDLQQSLFATSVKIDTAARGLPKDGAAARNLAEAREQLTLFQIEARRAISALHSDLLEETGGDLDLALRKTAESLAGDSDVSVFIHCQDAGLSLHLKTELLRISKELLTNAFRHAHPKRVVLTVDASADTVRLEIKDDGLGFEPDEQARAPGTHYGLAGLRARAAHLDGEMQINSSAGAGTHIRFELPRVPSKLPPHRSSD